MINAYKILSYIDFHDRYRWSWAHELIDLGDASIGRDESGDMQQTHQAFKQSLDIFTEMGADRYVEDLQVRLNAL